MENVENALKDVIETLGDVFDKERMKSEPYKRMFKGGNTFEGMLSTIEHEGSEPMFNAQLLLEQKGYRVNREVFDFLLAVPYLASVLERQISDKEGHVCCVDKVYYVLAGHLKGVLTTKQHIEQDKE